MSTTKMMNEGHTWQPNVMIFERRRNGDVKSLAKLQERLHKFKMVGEYEFSSKIKNEIYVCFC